MNPPRGQRAWRGLRGPLLVLALALAAGCPRFHAGPPPGAPATARFVEVDGVALHTRVAGSGPAVLFIHGYASSMEMWRGVFERVARDHRAIAVDLKGFGWSARPPGDYSPPAQAALVWKVLDKLGVDDVTIVGHSWGSSVSLAMALSAPARVRRIALYDAYVYEEQVPSFFRWARLGGVGEVLFGLFYRQRLDERAPLAYHDPRFVTQRRVDALEREAARPGTTAAALAAARGQRFAAVSARYRTISAPTLLLWGAEDEVTPLRFGQRLAGELPDARLVVFPQCGHVPMLEARTASTRELLAFLAAEAAPAPARDTDGQVAPDRAVSDPVPAPSDPAPAPSEQVTP